MFVGHYFNANLICVDCIGQTKRSHWSFPLEQIGGTTTPNVVIASTQIETLFSHFGFITKASLTTDRVEQ